MIPFLFIALGLFGVFAAYELSPKVQAWTDEHVRAIQAALAAHRVADEHLAKVHVAPDRETASQHAHDAAQANREAAKQTADAARTAMTPQQRAMAEQSAVAVDARDEQITVTVAQIGVGQCGVRSYAGVTARLKDALLAKLHSEGMVVTGDGPWDIDTGQYSVKLRAAWDPRARELKLVVTTGAGGYAGLVSCDKIWGKIDPILKEILKS